ncbi:MAG: ring-cleaving dioxygenase [Anaerolineales bacterium]|nr:ring-cleaving dioxygenase [Anaerolineales bacterium]
MQLTGIHHVTAVSARIAENVDFYTRVLGLRLVKKSVNQDDVSAYHLFYADKLGSPGTDMTFFDWPDIGANVRGTDSIAGATFRVGNLAALEFWSQRFDEIGVNRDEITEFAGRQLLPFEDPEGQRLYLVDDRGAAFEGEIWQRPDIPDEYALRGFYSIILSIPSIDQLAGIFKHILNYEEVDRTQWIDQKSNAVIYATTQNGAAGTEVWLLEQPHEARARLGAGGVHHVAFRVKDFETQKKWHSRLSGAGLSVSNLIDRFWFRSIYFRVSNGILFEIATDGPGFAIDEAQDNLGEKLVLPPFLENRRREIEAELMPIAI